MVSSSGVQTDSLGSKMDEARQMIEKLNPTTQFDTGNSDVFEKSVGLRRQYLESLSDDDDEDGEEELHSESRSDDRGHDIRERVEPAQEDREAARDDSGHNSIGRERDNNTLDTDSDYMESISFYARREEDDRIFDLSEDDDELQGEEEDDHTDRVTDEERLNRNNESANNTGKDLSKKTTNSSYQAHEGFEDGPNTTQDTSNLSISAGEFSDDEPLRVNEDSKVQDTERSLPSQGRALDSINDTPTDTNVSPSKSDTYVFEEDEPSIGFIQSSADTAEIIDDYVAPDKRTYENYSPFDALEEEDYQLPKGSDLAVLMRRDNYSPFDALEEEDYKLTPEHGVNTHESHDSSNVDSNGDSHSTMAHSNLSKDKILTLPNPRTTSLIDVSDHQQDDKSVVSSHHSGSPEDNAMYSTKEDVAEQPIEVLNEESLDESDSMSRNSDAITEPNEESRDHVEKAHDEMMRMSPSEDLEEMAITDEGDVGLVATDDESNGIFDDAGESRDPAFGEEGREDDGSARDDIGMDGQDEAEQSPLAARSFDSKDSDANSDAAEVMENSLDEEFSVNNHVMPVEMPEQGLNEEPSEFTAHLRDGKGVHAGSNVEKEEILKDHIFGNNAVLMDKDQGDDLGEKNISLNFDHDYDNDSTGPAEDDRDPSVDEIVDDQSDSEEAFRSSNDFSPTFPEVGSAAPLENEQEKKIAFDDSPYRVRNDQGVACEEEALLENDDEVLTHDRSMEKQNVGDNCNSGQSSRVELLMKNNSVNEDNFATVIEGKGPEQPDRSRNVGDSGPPQNEEMMFTDSQLSFDDDNDEENPFSYQKAEDSSIRSNSGHPVKDTKDEQQEDQQDFNYQSGQDYKTNPYTDYGEGSHYKSETNVSVEEKEDHESDSKSKLDSLGELLEGHNNKSGAAKADLYASFMAQRGDDMGPPLVVMESNSSLSSSSSKFETNDVAVISPEDYGFGGESDFPYAIYSRHTQPKPRHPPATFVGNRLYNQAIQKQRTKAIYKKNDANVKRDNTLDLATRNYGASKRSSSVSNDRKGMSIYSRLYNVTTKGKQLETEARRSDPSPVRTRSLSRPRSGGSQRSGPRSSSTFSRLSSTPKPNRTNKKDDESMIAVQSVTRTSSRTRSRNPDGMTTNERLYNLAKKKRILEMERERRKRCDEEGNKPKSSPRNGPSVPILGQSDIYSRLYHLAKSKRDEKEKKLQRVRENEVRKVESRYKSPYRLSEREAQEGFSRLYSKSYQKQIEGRKRREAIALKNQPHRDYTPKKTITPEQAADMYNRGMVKKMQLEIKREEEGLTTDYVSPLLNPLVEDPKRSSTPSKPRDRASSVQRPQSRSHATTNNERSSSRIRARSRLRSMSPDVRSRASFSRNSNSTPIRNRSSIASSRSTTPQKQHETPVTSRAPTPVSRSSRRSYTPSRKLSTPNTRTRSPTPTRARESTPMRRQKQDSTRQLLRKLENEMHSLKGDMPRKETDTIKTASTKGTSSSERTYPIEKEIRAKLSPTEESGQYLTHAQSDDYY